MIDKYSTILCVCTHNYFRSQIMKWLLQARGYIHVRSAGTESSYIGALSHPLVLAAIESAGGHCSGYQARQLVQADIDFADVILCAEKIHADVIISNYKCSCQIDVIGVPDNGVDNPEAVRQATAIIVEFLDKWN